jgi:tripartite-type tricarboxylate transporter receptor subunit TctC
MPTAKGHIAAGTLRPLAVTSPDRLPEYKDVMAVAETFPGFDFAGWWALAAPTGVPEAIVARVNREMAAILNDPAVVEKLKNAGFVGRGGGNLQQVRDYVQSQHKAWATLVKEIGLQPE